VNLTETQNAIILKAINLAEIANITSNNKAVMILAKELLQLRDQLNKEDAKFLDDLYKELHK
jgi:hypothetical protein